MYISGVRGTDISSSEQAPGNAFHPRDKSIKIDCGLLRPCLCNKKDPER